MQPKWQNLMPKNIVQAVQLLLIQLIIMNVW